MTSCSISLSSVRSATIFFSRVFSSSSAFSRRISSGSKPPYFFFQLKYVAWLIPAFRQISATRVPCSPCFRMNAFCASVNFDAFMRFRSSPSQENLAENSRFKRSSFQGAEQGQSTATRARLLLKARANSWCNQFEIVVPEIPYIAYD